MTRRKNRGRRFGQVLVQVAGSGSEIIHHDDRFVMPHWPGRYRSIDVNPDGTLDVLLKDGTSRRLDPAYDAAVVR